MYGSLGWQIGPNEVAGFGSVIGPHLRRIATASRGYTDKQHQASPRNSG